MSEPHVVIVGAGFAGLWAARGLARALVRVTVIDRSNHRLFQPLLYQVATAGLSASDIATPLRHLLRRQANATVLMAEVVRVDVTTKLLQLTDGTTHAFDQLLLAAGSTHAYFGRDNWATHAPGLKTLDDALVIRRRILSAFERAEAKTHDDACTAWLTFAVIGGGPTGVELAGTLAEIARHTLRGEFRRSDPGRARVLLIEAGPCLLSALPESLSEKARRQLERLGVEVHTGTPVTAVDNGGLALGTERIATRTVLWAAGIAASPLGYTLGVALDRAGRVAVNSDLSVPNHPDIYVIGDLASLSQDGKPVPGVAPAAKQMGTYVAKTLAENLRATRLYRSAIGTKARLRRSAAAPPSPISAMYACRLYQPGGFGWASTSFS